MSEQIVQLLISSLADLTREKLITAMESMKGFDPGVLPVVPWVKGNHDSPVKWRAVVWKKGTLQDLP